MALTKSEAKTSRLIFYAAAIVAVLYGLLFLSMPERVFQLSHDPGVPTDAGWLRWTGAFLIGIALAAWLAATQPDRQRALVVGLALSYLLVALSLLYSTCRGVPRSAMVHLGAHPYQSWFDGCNDLADHQASQARG
jgi:hypothetical protein